MNDELQPANVPLTGGLATLPEYAHAFRPRWPGDEGGFVGAQMRLYAMEAMQAERDRCALLCEARAKFEDLNPAEALREVAASIRGA